jgi:hypothetical protein
LNKERKENSALGDEKLTYVRAIAVVCYCMQKNNVSQSCAEYPEVDYGVVLSKKRRSGNGGARGAMAGTKP